MTATNEILVALDASYGSASSKAFIAALCEGEGGVSWRTLYSAGTLIPPTTDVQVSVSSRIWVGSMTSFPTWGGARLTSGLKTTAAGAPQFIDTTYASIAAVTNRNSFEAQDQIENCWVLAAQAFAAHSPNTSLHTTLEAGGSSLALIPTYLGKIWPGGCDSGFPKRYAKNLPLVSTTHAPQIVQASSVRTTARIT